MCVYNKSMGVHKNYFEIQIIMTKTSKIEQHQYTNTATPLYK